MTVCKIELTANLGWSLLRFDLVLLLPVRNENGIYAKCIKTPLTFQFWDDWLLAERFFIFCKENGNGAEIGIRALHLPNPNIHNKFNFTDWH